MNSDFAKKKNAAFQKFKKKEIIPKNEKIQALANEANKGVKAAVATSKAAVAASQHTNQLADRALTLAETVAKELNASVELEWQMQQNEMEADHELQK